VRVKVRMRMGDELRSGGVVSFVILRLWFLWPPPPVNKKRGRTTPKQEP